MADAGTIARFMVELAFKQDEGSAQKFVKTIDQSEQAVGALQQAVNDLGKAVQDLGRVLGGSAVEEGSRKFANNAHKVNQSSEALRKGLSTIATTAVAAGTAWVAGISKIATEYEKLYYTARRIGGTVGDLKAAGDAANQAGIGADALGGALEGLTSQVRASPGIRMMVNNWIGADWDKVKDKVGKGLIPVLDRLTKMPRELAYQWADQLGISRRVLDDWIVNGEEFKKRMAEVSEIQRRGGVDQEKLAQQSKEFWNSLRIIGVQIEQIWGKAFQEAYPAIKLVLDTLTGVLNIILAINNNVPGAALVESLVAATVSARILLGVLGRLTGLQLGGSLLSFRALGTALARVGSMAKFALGPWGILIGVAVEAALHWRELADAFGEIGSKIGQAASLVASNVSKAFSDLLNTLKPITDAISAIIKPIGDAIGYVAEKLGLVSTEQEKAAQAAERAKPGYVPGYGVQPQGQPTEQGLKPPEGQPGQHPTGEFFGPYGGRKPRAAAGGIVPVEAHAGEMILPAKLSQLFIGLANTLGTGGKGGDPWGDAEIKTPLGRMLDWLSGSLVPKVRIDNVEDFEPEEAHSGEGDGKPGPGGIRQGMRARTGMGGRAGGGGAGGGGSDGGGGGGPGPSSPMHVHRGRDGGGAGGSGHSHTSGGGGADASRKGGDAGAAGPLAGEAIDVFKKRGWSDAAVQAVMAHGLGEGGFGESWKQSGAINPKTGQREQSFGHWQLNMQGGEGPAYMAWAEKNKLDPKKTGNQALYVAETMERLQQRNPEKYGGFTQQQDFGKAFGQFETGFEKSAGGVAGKMAYANREGTPETARKALEGYNKGTLNTPAGTPGAGGGGGMNAEGGAYGVPGAKMNYGGTGALGTQAQAAQNLTQVKVPGSNKSVTVHKEAAESFQGFLGELQSTGYKIGDIGGYNPREKRGGSGWSEHAFGTAIDINAGKNAMGGQGTDMPANIKEMAAKYGLVWGGDWSGKSYDPMHFQWGGSKPWKEQQDKARAVAADQGKKTGEKLAQVAGEKPPDAKSPIEVFNDKLIEAARKQAETAAKKGEAGAAPPEAPPPPVEKGETAAEGKGVMPPGGLITPADYAKFLGQPAPKGEGEGSRLKAGLAPMLGEHMRTRGKDGLAPMLGEHLRESGANRRVEEMKEKMEAAKTGGGDLKAGGALTKSGADFDRALAPIGASGLSPGAGGDTVTNNSGGNRNMNVNATNNVTINGNLNESPGSLARRFSDNSERFYADLGRNNRSNVS